MRPFSLMTVVLGAASSLVLVFSSCTSPQSERCKKVCQQETECAARQKVQEGNFPYDLDECIAACVALERDKEGRQQVEAHVECAKEAEGDCERLMQCR